MSRGYRVAVPQVVSQVIARAEDSVALSLELLPILKPEEMLGLLREALGEAGWSPNKAGQLARALGIVTACLEDEQITLTASKEAEVTARGANTQRAEANAKDKAKQKEASLRRALSEQLQRAERDLRVEMEAALQGVYARALKRRAAQLGDITSIEEREVDGEIELTIRVEV